MIVKICGITNREDARTAVEAGATALGFNFYPNSPRAISVQDAKQIIDGVVPPGILKIGIFVNEQPDAVARTMQQTGLDVAQVIGQSCPISRFWKVHRVSDDFSSDDLQDDTAEAFVLDTPSESLQGGTGQTFDWSRARIPGRRIIIAGGLGPDNVARAIRECRPWGVDACSRLESAPGRKDPEKVKAFVAAALSL